MKVPGPTALDATLPIVITRSHEVGQRYAITMTHSGVVTNVYDAEATVTRATPEQIELDLLVKSLTTAGARRLADAAFEITVYPARRSVDAEQTGGPDGSLFLTAIEAMLGAVCWTPTEPHRPGDTWTDERRTSWHLVGYAARHGRHFARFTGEEGSETSGRSYDLELAVDDGYTGTCTVDTRLSIGGEPIRQRYQIAVTPLPPAPR